MRKIILCIVLFIFSLYAHSQLLKREIDYIKAESPSAASLSRFIDNVVNLYNGSVSVNLPIYELKDGAISIPLMLNYSSSGIRVDQEASWVGLGWNLNVGGSIIQQCIGYNDEEDVVYDQIMSKDEFAPFKNETSLYGFRKFQHTDKLGTVLHNALRGMDYSYMKSIAKFEPDVFCFNIPGNSGKFVIDYLKGNKPYILNREQDFRIELTKEKVGSMNQTKKIIITASDGVKHHFSRLVEPEFGDLNNVIFTLNESIYPNGQKIKYEYEHFYVLKGNQSKVIRFGQWQDKRTCYQDFQNYPLSDLSTAVNACEVVLKKIETTNYTIDFELSDSRIDLPISDLSKNGFHLKNIYVKNKKDEILKKYQFDYDYFSGWGNNVNEYPFYVPENARYKRLKLKSFYELANSKYPTNIHNFGYEQSQLPQKNATSVDYWGYNNGCTQNIDMMPNLNDLLMFKENFTDYSSWGLKKKIKTFLPKMSEYENMLKNNRAYDFNSCKAWILNQIEYPTGGITEFEYEPNTFSSFGANGWSLDNPYWDGDPGPPTNEYHFIPAVEQKNSYIEKIQAEDQYTVDGDKDEIREFVIEKKTAASFDVIFSKDIHHTWADIQDVSHRVTLEIYQDSKWVQIDEIYFGTSGTIIPIVKKNLTLYPGRYRLTVKLSNSIFICSSCSSGGHQDPRICSGTRLYAEIRFPVIPETLPVHSQGCGIRVKNVKHYSSKTAVNPQKTVSYSYNTPGTEQSSGMLHDILNFYNANYLYYLDAGRTSGGHTNCQNEWALFVDIHSNNNASNPYGNSSGVGYSYVTEVSQDKGKTFKTVYEYHNQAGFFKYGVGGNKYDSPLNSKLKNVTLYNTNDKIVKQTVYDYKSILYNEFFSINFYSNTEAIKFLPQEYFSGEIKVPSNGFEQIYIGQIPYISYYKNAIDFYDIILSKTETFTDGVTTKEEYIYDPITLQLKERKTINNQNENIVNKYQYSFDYNCGVYKEMNENNMLSNIVEEKIYRNDKYLGSKLTQFTKNKYNQFVPSIMYFSEVKTLPKDITGFSCNGVNNQVYPFENVVYKDYDSCGNLNYVIHNEATHIVYLWGYGGQYLIAEIKNATYEQINKIIDINALVAKSEPSEQDWKLINDLRTNISLGNIQVMTYKYEPLKGMVEAIDMTNTKVYYAYDKFNRLQSVRDHEKNIRTTYKYNYANTYLPLKFDVIYQKEYANNQYITINSTTSGGSSKFNYYWTLKDESGKILSTYNDNRGSFLTLLNTYGKRILTGICEDLVTGETIEKTVEFSSVKQSIMFSNIINGDFSTQAEVNCHEATQIQVNLSLKYDGRLYESARFYIAGVEYTLSSDNYSSANKSFKVYLPKGISKFRISFNNWQSRNSYASIYISSVSDNSITGSPTQITAKSTNN